MFYKLTYACYATAYPWAGTLHAARNRALGRGCLWCSNPARSQFGSRTELLGRSDLHHATSPRRKRARSIVGGRSAPDPWRPIAPLLQDDCAWPCRVSCSAGPIRPNVERAHTSSETNMTPAGVVRIIWAIAPTAELRDAMLGDFAEEYETRLGREGRARARCHAWREGLLSRPRRTSSVPESWHGTA